MEKKKYSWMAIICFVLGCISLPGGMYFAKGMYIQGDPYFLMFIVPILAIILGFVGLNQVKKHNGLFGKNLAWLGIIFAILGIFFFVIISSMLR